MALSGRSRKALELACASYPAGNEIANAIDAASGDLGTPSTPVTPVAVTFTAGGTPTEYATPAGTLTVANSTTPTVVELLNYCNELRGNIASLQAILHAHGLTT
ncbi:MAG: hypothetical protein P4L84_17970 [Isosphaeraceae bacterium]|nr:hypothetical protein [Isosphaeraceae bacterium]